MQAGGRERPERNALEILRFVVEDEAISDADLSGALAAIVAEACAEAGRWLCTSVKMWNPDERVRSLVAAMADLRADFVVRESDSIASLLWLGDDSVSTVEWVANEKFEWC
ncbi:hypothetical protein CDD83_8615 [Cordyceps sp. RAO-2017]|nr:hypothetical protein CDD83_8615 [Cordyceps sp. RAO-2017]